ncbi:methyltransferase domain-containing protein [Vibrio hepatarius]|uniref:Methyltransferase domain-containing protein n=1 Tax=Vibrio hepatarius TaxID=171383 RepID=A0A0M0HX64_9VIBR|nr:methyltransferase domain-containing protein [Vibrio hepatarius]KOO06676.1 hypothetical protein AKJ31_15490 [Vibrio hepatarius]
MKKCKLCKGDLSIEYGNCKDINFSISNEKFDWYKCKRCGSFSIDDPNLSVSEYYKDYKPHKIDVSNLPNSLSIFIEKILAVYSEDDKFDIIDVGCGSGVLLYQLKKKFPNARLYGTDVTISPAINNLSDYQDINFFESEIKDLSIEKTFDVVVSSQLLEHLDDPETMVEFLECHTNSKSLIIFDIPNVESVSFKLFGRNWIHLDTPRHRVLYTRTGLNYLFREFKLTNVVYTGSNLSLWSSFCNSISVNLHNNSLFFKVIRKVVIKLLDLFVVPDDKINFTLSRNK